MTQLHEFNAYLKFMPENFWLMPEQQTNLLCKEIFQGQYHHLDILRHLPFSMPFKNRVNIFYKFLNDEKQKHSTMVKVPIRRVALFEDGFQTFK